MTDENQTSDAERLLSQADHYGATIDHDDAVVVIIGSGAGGGTLAHELTAKGVPCVVLEAGPYLMPEDYHNDEWASFNQMAWLDARTASGPYRVARDFPNLPAWIVKAVGGSTTHWSGATPRFRAYEFKTRSYYGGLEGANLLDWPIGLEDLAPYYDRAERAIGSTHRQGRPPLPANNNYKVFANGAEKVGYKFYATGPYGTNAEPYDGRPASIQDGFNFQGDKSTAKWSIAVREIPRALATGKCDLRPRSQAVQVTHDAQGRADAVLYLDKDGDLHRQAAKVVCVAGNSIESPRLLLMSASAMHPDGLANSSGQVGRNYMRHLTGSVYARFESPVRMHRGETMAGIIADEARLDSSRGFVGGYYMETLSLGPAFLAAFVDPGAWGPGYTELLDAYESTAGMWIVGEDIPQERNRVTLNTKVVDQWGLPAPDVWYEDHANDTAMREHGYGRADMLYEAVGALGTHHTPPYPATHNLGTCRMSERPEDGVVDRWGQAHDVPGLFVSDGSVMTTGAAANPTLTIVALAIRQAERIADQLGEGSDLTGQTALADSLRAALGDGGCAVLGRPLDRLVRAHDASHYLLHPQAVAVPRDTAEVAEVMRACARLGVPLTFRGGGTSLSGQALSDAVLVDTRTAFADGVEVLDDGARVRVQPGVTVRRVNARLAPHRRRLGPDPASEGACTVGGVIANNSSGMQCGTELNAYHTVESMVLVLPSGLVLDSADPAAPSLLAEREPVLHAGLLRLRDRVRGDPASVATVRRLFAIKNTMGYGVNAFLDHDDPLQILVRLMVGSEGTLGFVASAVLRTVEVLPHAATGLLVFDDLQAAADAVGQVSTAGVATAELLDAASLRVAQQDPACPEQIRRLTVRDEAALLVELQADSADQLLERHRTAGAVLDTLPLASVADLTSDMVERAALWRTRKGLYSAVAGARPAGSSALLEDVAVPVERLGELSRGLTRLLAAHAYDGSVIFGHARDGNLHFLLNERFDAAPSLRRYEAFTTDLVDLVLDLGGTLKAEHGTGRIMAPFVERQYGAELTAVMRELKALLDPQGTLNPGSVLTDDDQLWLRDLKTTPAVEPEVDRCVECGFCEPVCPSRDLTITPRQRIVARREMVAAERRGDTALVASLRADYEYDGVQTCAADGMCATACPVLIDTGDLVRRLRARSATRAAERVWAVAAGHWDAATRAASTALTLADRMPDPVPVALSRAGRALASDETVPLYDPGLSAGGRPRPEIEDPEADAVLFSACVHTMFGGGVTGALRRLCERAGVHLRTPPGVRDLCCGTPWKSKGHLAGHARMVAQVRSALAVSTDDGRLPVVVDASSCAEGLVLAVAGTGIRVVDAVDFVATFADRLTVRSTLTSVVVHPTCSSTQLGSTASLVALAHKVSDDVTVPVDWGCCAFAGDRGLLHPELTASATAREAAEVARRTHAAYVSSNRTCEIGMARATGRPYRHVLEVLDEAVGG